jgi:DNA polymerase
MIEKGLKRPRSSVYIGNVLKCRPPRNRDPRPDEIAACRPYLDAQLALIRPRVVVALGRIAGNILTEQNSPMKTLRGRWWAVGGIPLRAIYHPAYLLRQREAQGGKSRADRDTWEDLQAVQSHLREG